MSLSRSHLSPPPKRSPRPTAPSPTSTIIPLPTQPRTTPSINATQTLGTFTGQVYIDPIYTAQQPGPEASTTSASTTASTPVSIINVTFTRNARTHWHTHTQGQLLRVLAGQGWVCDQGCAPRRIQCGDVVWCPAGVVHWHGAGDEGDMVHEAVSLGGIEWFDEVGEGEYEENGQREGGKKGGWEREKEMEEQGGDQEMERRRENEGELK